MTTREYSKHIILYADDDQDDLVLIEEAFYRYVANVDMLTARDGEEAILHLRQLAEQDRSPCLIILDVNMPRLNGKETLVRLRQMEKFNEVPVVLFSTSSQPGDIEFAKKYKAGFITKPLNSQELFEITNRFLDSCSSEIRDSFLRNAI